MLIQRMFTSEIFREMSVQYNQMTYNMTTDVFFEFHSVNISIRSLNVYNASSVVKFIAVTDVFRNLKYLICNIEQL